MESNERRLLERARRGDSAAMDALLQQNERTVYRFGLKMCGSEDTAKEVLQRTLFTAFRSLQQFRGEGQLSSWLYQIARSHCVRTQRAAAASPESLESADALSVAAPAATPEQLAHAKEVGAALEAAIRALPKKHRDALLLRDVEGLSAEEASRALGIPVANLKTRLHRARAELRRRLAGLHA